MVRRATREDIPTLFRHGQWFAENVNMPGGFDPRVFMRTLVENIANPAFLFLIGDQCSLGAVFSPSWYGPGETSQELWLRGGRGGAGRLVSRWEEEARARGAVALGATTQIDHDGERVARLIYERRGFRRREHLLMKEL